MLALTSSLLAFSPMAPLQSSPRVAVSMSEAPIARRSVIGTFAAAVAAAPFAALADGASSPAVRERARAIYGSRVGRLADASTELILEEKNCFTLFTTGVYRTDVSSKEKVKTLKALEKKAVASAKAGDKAGANAAVKEFVKVGEIEILDTIEYSIYNPKQRRNPGAPTTDTIEDQMGTQKFALYQPLKGEEYKK